ncbi:MAG: flavoprotein oxidoreductase, partial [Aeromicrobium sp.]|nr:flavoprotein oxidoreductase [Aeromicrobium sp.]
MGTRVVIIGGDAAGMSVASEVRRRLGDDDEVVVLERGTWTSYSACGIPYWIAGAVDSPDDLVARTPDEHRANGIDVRLGAEVTAIDPVNRRLSISGSADLGYDRLVIATGA